MVAEAFIPNPLNKPEINHLDSNPLNNNVNNLEWVTRKENILHARKYGNMKVDYNKDNIIYDYLHTNMTINEIIIKHNINKSILYNIKDNNNIYSCQRKNKGRKYNIDKNILLEELKNKTSINILSKKYKCSRNYICVLKYKFKKEGLI